VRSSIGILARHLDVAAKRDGADPVVSFAPAEAQQSFAKANGKDFHSDFEKFGRRVVSPLVDEDHYA
jgi:hypothetical protein